MIELPTTYSEKSPGGSGKVTKLSVSWFNSCYCPRTLCVTDGNTTALFLFLRQDCICMIFLLLNNFWDIVLYVFHYLFLVTLGHVFYTYHAKGELV